MDSFNLPGYASVVTGAASGIARATAVALARAGSDLVLADMNESGLEETRDLLKDTGSTVVIVPTDVRVREQLETLIGTCVDRFGRLDVMANIAGVSLFQPFFEVTEQDFDRMMSINLKAVLFGTQIAMKAMQDLKRGGSIVNAASAVLDLTTPGTVSYSVAKAGVVMVTRHAAIEGGPNGIRVNSIAPGGVITPMTLSSQGLVAEDGTVDQEKVEELKRQRRESVPLRMLIEADDIANAIVYLSSDAGRAVTGQVMRVNAGLTMPW